MGPLAILKRPLLEEGERGTPKHMRAPMIDAKVEIKETQEAFLYVVNLPGLKKEDMELLLNQGWDSMTITADVGLSSCSEEERAAMRESGVQFRGRFCRTLRLPKDSDRDNIKATCTREGLLTVTVPRQKKKVQEALAMIKKLRITSFTFAGSSEPQLNGAMLSPI